MAKKQDALKQIAQMPPWAWGLVGGAALAAVFAIRRPAATATAPAEYYLPEPPPAQQLPAASPEPVIVEKPVVVEVEKPVYVPVAPQDYPAAPVSVTVGEAPLTVKPTKTESPATATVKTTAKAPEKAEPLTKEQVQLKYEEELVKRLGPEKAKEWLKERPTPGVAVVGGQVYTF